MDAGMIIYIALGVIAAAVFFLQPIAGIFMGISRHRHSKYQYDQRVITEKTTHEMWDDTTPVMREETTRVKNADYTRVAPTQTHAPQSPSSVADKVKSMMGKTDMLVVIVTATLLLMTFFFICAAVWGFGQILGGLAA